MSLAYAQDVNMMRRVLYRASRPISKPNALRRAFSEGKLEPTPTNKQASVRSRFDRFVERTPRFLRPTVTGLRSAPFSHIVAFLILHELTAIVPLVSLAGAFHYWHWLPPYFAEGAWISTGVDRFGRYFRRKGWITEDEKNQVEKETKDGNASDFEEKRTTFSKAFKGGESATRWVVELATAYAIVKLLLPARIFISVWGAPWFARITVIPIRTVMGRLVKRRKTPPT
jgi:hypothetical protein